jgi:hypothetical protein
MYFGSYHSNILTPAIVFVNFLKDILYFGISVTCAQYDKNQIKLNTQSSQLCIGLLFYLLAIRLCLVEHSPSPGIYTLYDS